MGRIIKILALSLAAMMAGQCKSSGGHSSSGGAFPDIEVDPASSFLSSPEKSHAAAVLLFQSDGGSIARFDAFVTDDVIRRLSRAKNLKLIERTRLDLVLAEQKLGESGLISKNDAIKIGSILPVDSVVAGTYRYRDEKIRVNGRIVDVTTGKVRDTFSFTIPYPARKPAAVDAPVKTDTGCERVQKPVILALRDLTTPPAVNRAVEEAIRIPFYKKPCGMVHRKVMWEFERGNLYPAQYHEFLYRTLENMEDPREDYYAVQDIFSYFASDKKITETEWAAARETLKRGWHRFHLKYLFNVQRYPAAVVNRRAEELLQLARKREIGRPYALSEYRIAADILSRGFMRNTEEGIDFSLFLIDQVRNLHEAPDKEMKSFFGMLESCYKGSLSRESQNRALDLMIRLVKPREPEKNLAHDLWNFASQTDEKIREKKKKSRYLKEPVYEPVDVNRLNREFAPWLCLNQAEWKGTYSGKDVDAYMKRHRIACPATR